MTRTMTKRTVALTLALLMVMATITGPALVGASSVDEDRSAVTEPRNDLIFTPILQHEAVCSPTPDPMDPDAPIPEPAVSAAADVDPDPFGRDRDTDNDDTNNVDLDGAQLIPFGMHGNDRDTEPDNDNDICTHSDPSDFADQIPDVRDRAEEAFDELRNLTRETSPMEKYRDENVTNDEDAIADDEEGDTENGEVDDWLREFEEMAEEAAENVRDARERRIQEQKDAIREFEERRERWEEAGRPAETNPTTPDDGLVLFRFTDDVAVEQFDKSHPLWTDRTSPEGDRVLEINEVYDLYAYMFYLIATDPGYSIESFVQLYEDTGYDEVILVGTAAPDWWDGHNDVLPNCAFDGVLIADSSYEPDAIPFYVRWMMADEMLFVVGNGVDQERILVELGDNREIKRVTLLAVDESADVQVRIETDETIARYIVAADSPGTAALEAYRAGAVSVRGDGPWNRIRFGAIDLGVRTGLHVMDLFSSMTDRA